MKQRCKVCGKQDAATPCGPECARVLEQRPRVVDVRKKETA